MRIERMSDHQIRCTLTREDLDDRQLQMSELAYGSEKAKDLFRDMMREASYQFGFETENIPLMIEAIPLGGECIILIITKVEDPEELDTRFARFAPSVLEEGDDFEEILESLAESADEILGLFMKLQQEHFHATGADNSHMADIGAAIRREINDERRAADEGEMTRIFSLDSLPTAIHAAKVISGMYDGVNSLYKHPQYECYMLVVGKGALSSVEFSKILNILSEYADAERSVNATEAYMAEHFEPLIKDRAIQELAKIPL